MTMTKAEKAAFEALERDLAFRWPTVAEPEPMAIPTRDEDKEGWVFNAYNASVERRWSKATTNGGFFGGERASASQRGIPLYRTQGDAYAALRWAICRKYADQLRNIDLRTAVAKDTDDGE